MEKYLIPKQRFSNLLQKSNKYICIGYQYGFHESAHQKSVSSVDGSILNNVVTFNFRLKEEWQDEDEAGHDRDGQGLEGREGRVCKLPADEVFDGSDGRVEPVPGQQDREVGRRVEQQRRKGIEHACKRNVELENI